ncbi:MAG: DNA alkylation repair protein [Eubacterium sp.]|nr:DNA alkylation repair protein [Eubacterium sp.]
MGFTREDLKKVDESLREMADEKYREFHSRLIPGVESIFYGVRVPALRKLARQLVKGDWRGFVELTKDSSVYEFNMLCGMVCALAKCDFEEKLEYVKKFIPSIDNWAVCDIVCGDLKDVKNNQERMYEFVLPYLKSQNEYEVRFAVVILMQYFVTDEYINDVLKNYDDIRHKGYYVKMSVAWGISICYVKYRNITLEYLASCNLDDFTYNKSVQKMIESFRVSREDKEMLRSMKR